MEENTSKFYANRILSAFLAILLFVVCYFAYTKLLSDPYGLTNIAVIVIWGITGIAFFIGVVYTIKTFDPNPVVEMMPEGMIIRTFLFIEDFIPWKEVTGVQQEEHTQRSINMAGYIKITTSFLRIYRPMGRSLAINLSLLNKRGNEFNHTISGYLNNPYDQTTTTERGISDERLLKKYHQSIKKSQKLGRENTSLATKLFSLFLSILILLWLINYFRTIDFNPITIIGFIVVFLITWVIMLFLTEYLIQLITYPKGRKEIVDHQIENYRKMIRARTEPNHIESECVLSFPVIENNETYFKEINGNIHFNALTDEGNIEEVILPLEEIIISHLQKDDNDAAYRIYAEKANSGIFKNELIGHYRELSIPH